MGEAAPKPKASARKKKGDSASSTTPPTKPPTTTVESAPRLSATAKGKQPSRATTHTHISQQSGSGIDEGTGSKPGVSDVPSDDLEEELSWNSSDDEDVGSHEEGKKSDESDYDRDEGSNDDSEETVKAGAGFCRNIYKVDYMVCTNLLLNKTMATTIDQQVALDEALVPSTQRLRIGRSNFRLPSDIQSKESTLQVFYDVLRNSHFFRAFQVTVDVPEIYMQEFWATATLHHNSIRFKMDTKKSVLDLEAFREMLHISPRIPSQSFAELPSEEEILEFLRYLRHSHEIRHLMDVNVNKLYQPWRSFASVINKCPTGKSSGVDSFRLSQAQILWGLYYRSNVDYAYLIWEDFVYQVEHKNQKRSNEMYYPRFTKVIIDYFMTRKPSIPRRNRINWHYVRDDVLFSTINVVSRHQTTQQYDAILPIELTTDDIRNSKAYKEYYACATGEAAQKPKASARKKKGDSASSTTPPTPTPTTTAVSAPRLSAIAKGKQPARATTPTEPTDVERTEAKQLQIVLKKSRQETHISQQRGSGTDEGIGSRPGVPDVPSDDSEEDLSRNSSDDEVVDVQDEGDKHDESDDGSDDGNDDDNNETVKAGPKKSGKGGDEVRESERESDEEETRQKEDESFNPIPRTPEGSEDESNDEED
nr:hypothetical protein [Tanacetum cinerariifolium]